GSARKRTLVAESNRSRQAWDRDRRECARDVRLGVLNRPSREEVVLRRRLMVDANIALIPVLPLNQIGKVIVESPWARRSRISVDQLSRNRVPSVRGDLVARKRIANKAGAVRVRPRGQRIVNRRCLAEVTASHRKGRYVAQ